MSVAQYTSDMIEHCTDRLFSGIWLGRAFRERLVCFGEFSRALGKPKQGACGTPRSMSELRPRARIELEVD